MATMSATDRLVIAGPSSLFRPSSSSSSSTASASQRQFLLLPHPRTGLPAYFLPSASSSSSASSASLSADDYDEIYELQSSKSDRKARSWFLGGSRGEAEGKGDIESDTAEAHGMAGEKGWVIQDSSLHLLSQIDPAFLLLPMLDVLLPAPSPTPNTATAPTSSTLLAESGSYLPREDLFESVASAMHRRLAQAHSQLASKGSGKGRGEGGAASLPPPDEQGSWADIPAFGALALARKSLEQLCSTQEMGGAPAGGGGEEEGEQYFRPCPRRIVSFLRGKVLALARQEVFRSHPATLGRMLDRAVDDPLEAIARANGTLKPTKEEGGQGEGEEDLKARRVRTELALDLVRAYVPVGGRVEELFECVVKGGLMRQLDREERGREDHEGREGRDAQQLGEENEDEDAEAAMREQEAKSAGV